ncbi:hypothetical protein Tco_0218020 [Tanacetum coccineum]
MSIFASSYFGGVKSIPPEALVAHVAWVKGSKEIVGLMIMTMEPDIQRNLENLGAYDMLKELKTLFSQQRLGYSMSLNLAVSLFLVSMSKKYDSFVQNYNMHGMGKTVNELHVMLNMHDQTLPKKDHAPVLHGIQAGRVLETWCLRSGNVGGSMVIRGEEWW